MNDNWLKNLLKKLKLNESTISMILGALVIVVVGALIFNYFKGVSQEEKAEVAPEEGIELVKEEGKLVPAGLPRVHQVSQGEYLWKIAEKYYGSGYNWVDIAQENKLANANFLAVNQELTIPKVEVRKPTVKLAEAPTNSQAITGSNYTVVRGDNLWEIALRAYGDGYRWVEIARANQLINPNIIHAGNVFTLPR
jgi:nucleoid-associated protein YgaU